MTDKEGCNVQVAYLCKADAENGQVAPQLALNAHKGSPSQHKQTTQHLDHTPQRLLDSHHHDHGCDDSQALHKTGTMACQLLHPLATSSFSTSLASFQHAFTMFCASLVLAFSLILSPGQAVANGVHATQPATAITVEQSRRSQQLSLQVASTSASSSTALLRSPFGCSTPGHNHACSDTLVTSELTALAASRGAAAAASTSASTSQHTAAASQHTTMGIGGDVSSQAEDQVLEMFRQLEARVDSAMGAVSSSMTDMMGHQAQQTSQVAESAHALINEVWEVVDMNYMDARQSGFSRDRWSDLRDHALSVPYQDKGAAYRAVRDMLARGVSDPYCRFITPEEFATMKKYDVTGVGLNLGTAEEYIKKTVSLH
eukprot:jgi/Chrzof1/15157/Cz09g29130.t1